MLMRYHFGLGVGHVYASHPADKSTPQEHDIGESDEVEADGPCGSDEMIHLESGSDASTDDEDVESQEDPSDDEQFYAMSEMYYGL